MPDGPDTRRTFHRFRLSPSLIAHVWKAVTRQYHRENLPVFATVLPRDGVVLDVGAHAGQFTKLFAKFCDRGRVISFEPGTYARFVLRCAALASAACRRRAMVLPMAVGAEIGMLTLNIPLKKGRAVGFGLSQLGDSPGLDSRFEMEIEYVPVTTIDHVAETLGLERVDFIKMDIEGYELFALAGAAQTLATHRPCVFLEVADAILARTGAKNADVFAFFAPRDYVAYSVVGSRVARGDGASNGDYLFVPRERADAIAALERMAGVQGAG